ncbi:MAG TPA: glycosyltransferase [Bacteroidia bacterium]|nr:glycosyltransferase [Bacteroidia bacterium]
MSSGTRIAVVSVINDLSSDHRVQKTCSALMESGYNVVLIGRELKHSKPLPGWPYTCIRMRLIFTQGPFFYVSFNIRLFFLLLNRKADLYYSNDLDTLWPNYTVSKLKGAALVYDSHELFCEVPELLRSPLKKRIWQNLEAYLVPKLKNCITVNESIARVFQEKYGVKFHSIRNIPDNTHLKIKKTRVELGLPQDKKIIILQGAGINVDRGSEELVDAMKYIDNAILLIIGSGDIWPVLKEKIRNEELENKVHMIEKLPRQDLLEYTHVADLGISIDKGTNLNYQYSLPNKIFDYIHSGIPVLASRLTEIEHLVNQYQVGEFIENHQSVHIAERIRAMLASDKLLIYRENTKAASAVLNWNLEKKKLLAVLNDLRR